LKWQARKLACHLFFPGRALVHVLSSEVSLTLGEERGMTNVSMWVGAGLIGAGVSAALLTGAGVAGADSGTSGKSVSSDPATGAVIGSAAADASAAWRSGESFLRVL
jgi:hypothetical protein